MFGWFKKKKDVDGFVPNERLIYSFWDGTDGYSKEKPNRRIDPMILYDKVYSKRMEISVNFKALDFPETQFAAPARNQLTKTIREIFGIKPLTGDMDLPEGGTLSDAECLILLDDFLVFSERLKKNLDDSAKCPVLQ